METKDRSISERISETANKQTPVRTRDLHANDWIQRKLEDAFLTLGYYYERKKNQHIDKPAEKRLDAELLGQLALAFYEDRPSEARSSKAIVFDQEYDNLFNEDVMTAQRLLYPYLLYRELEPRKRAIQLRKRKGATVPDEEAFLSFATFHIVNSMKVVAECKGLDLEEAVQRERAKSIAIDSIWNVVKNQMVKRSPTYTHAGFFKEKATTELIHKRIRGEGQ